MDSSYIVSGMLIGDEGKGTVTDYLANKVNAKYDVRHNGGSQAMHTVINGGAKHKFSQLGSAFMNEGVTTFLSSNTIVNPFSLINEANIYSREIKVNSNEVLKRVYMDKDALIVTPYHSLITKLNELARNTLQGSTGSGVSDVKRVYDKTGIKISIDDLIRMDDKAKDKMRSLHEYTTHILNSKRHLMDDEKFSKYINSEDILNLTGSDKDFLIRCYSNLINSNLLNITSFKEFYKGGNIIFEGSQGLMLDCTYGIKPNVTGCDTTNHYAYHLASEVGIKPISMGCVSVYNSRHGAGPLPTYDKKLNELIYDENQVPSYFQGVPTYGWLDLVILRYSLSINNTDEIFLTMVDRFNGIENLKICNRYKYLGNIDEKFIDTFEYYIDNNEVIITGIKNSDHLKECLEYTIPIYDELKGYDFNRNNIKSINDLPDELFTYIDYIEKNINKKITHISYGPDRSMKLIRK